MAQLVRLRILLWKAGAEFPYFNPEQEKSRALIWVHKETQSRIKLQKPQQRERVNLELLAMNTWQGEVGGNNKNNLVLGIEVYLFQHCGLPR